MFISSTTVFLTYLIFLASRTLEHQRRCMRKPNHANVILNHKIGKWCIMASLSRLINPYRHGKWSFVFAIFIAIKYDVTTAYITFIVLYCYRTSKTFRLTSSCHSCVELATALQASLPFSCNSSVRNRQTETKSMGE